MTVLNRDKQLFKPDLSQAPAFHRLSQHLWRGGQYGCMTQAVPYIADDGSSKVKWPQTWYPINQTHAILNQHNVYFGLYPVNQKLDRWKRGTIDETASMGGLFGEFDLNKWTGEGELLDYIQGLDPRPSVIIASGGGYHVYWLFQDTLILTDENRQWAKEHLYAWVTLWGSDKAAKDLRRVLRVPGTYNFKKEYDPPRLVTCVYEDYTALYDYRSLFELAAPFIPPKPDMSTRRVVNVDLDNKRVQRTVEHCIQKLSTTSIDRHDTLIRCAKLMGGLVAASAYNELEARALLEQGAYVNGLVGMYGVDKIQADIRDGLRYGMAEPLTIENEPSTTPKDYPTTMQDAPVIPDNGKAKPAIVTTESRFFNREIEAAALGLWIQDSRLFTAQNWQITSDDFYFPTHQLLMLTLQRMVDHRQGIDAITVKQALTERGQLDIVGGETYLNELLTTSGKPDNIASYVDKIIHLAEKRRAYTMAQTIQAALTSGEEDIHSVLESIKTAHPHKASSVSLMDSLDSDMARVYGLMTGEQSPYVRLGYKGLDRFLKLGPGDLVVIGARPSMGKTAFLLNILRNMGLPAWLWSGEMMAMQVAQRLIAIESARLFQDVPLTRITDGDLSTELDPNGKRANDTNLSEWQRYSLALRSLGKFPLTINDTAMNIHQIKSEARYQVQQCGKKIIAVDYLDLIKKVGDESSQEQAVALISTGLKELAKEMQVPVIALSQLGRQVENRADKRPMLADYRHSGQVEQDADIAMAIYRDDVYNDNSESPNTAEIIVLKQRNGATGVDALYFDKRTNCFKDLRKQEINLQNYGGSHGE